MKITSVCSVLFVLCVSTSVYAERTFRSDSITESKVMSSIHSVLESAKSTHKKVDLVLFAVGTQEYELTEDGHWKPTGPKADLYPLKVRMMAPHQRGDSIGHHNQGFTTPKWVFKHQNKLVELVAKSAQAFDSTSHNDVKWLLVELEKNSPNYCAVVRAETRGGIAPTNPNYAVGTRVGVGYETLYAFIKCTSGR